jgi:amino acid adenylation domain-containing protein
MLTDVETRRLTRPRANQVVPLPFDGVDHAFEAQVARTPDADAVVDHRERVTYAELNARANLLARRLATLGVTSDVPVGICLQRSVTAIVSVLAVLKAGGGYVPLDPSLPRERLRQIVQRSGMTLAITEPSSRLHLPDDGVHVIDVEEAIDTRESGATNLDGVTRRHQMAYVLYTSGSTGQPKGVVIPHGAVLNLAAALHARIYRGAPDRLRVSVNGPLAFDTSVKQIIQLLYGHTLHIVPDTIRGDAPALVRFLTDQAIDVFDCTPSQLRALVAAGFLDTAPVRPMRVLVGGEAIDPALWRTLAAAPGRRFFNMYGPTECTVDAVVGDVAVPPSSPTLGEPLANVRTYVVDTHLQLTPRGVAGELCIAGAGVGRGYLTQPGATADRFVPDPFTDIPGQRLYRTGDLVRHRSGRALEFLGRSDAQVKVRGYRIELGDVESALERHPDVESAAVVAPSGPGGDPQLVAYVVRRRRHPSDPGDLARHLDAQLPSYMIPAVIVDLDAMPLTANGKIDRRVLASRSVERTTGNGLPPRTSLEEVLSRIWADVLSRDRVGIDDNFFDLGGHSLLATQMVSRIRGVLHAEVPLRRIFEAPTIQALAPVLHEIAGGRAAAEDAAFAYLHAASLSTNQPQ